MDLVVLVVDLVGLVDLADLVLVDLGAVDFHVPFLLLLEPWGDLFWAAALLLLGLVCHEVVLPGVEVRRCLRVLL